MQNFSESDQLAPIRDQGKVYSAAGNGKIPFVSTEDIARVAQRLLLDEKPHNTDYIILGPELLSQDDVSCSFFHFVHWHAWCTTLSTIITLSGMVRSHISSQSRIKIRDPDFNKGRKAAEKMNSSNLLSSPSRAIPPKYQTRALKKPLPNSSVFQGLNLSPNPSLTTALNKVVKILTDVLSKPIDRVNLSLEEMVAWMQSSGMSPEYAHFLAYSVVHVGSSGAEERLNNTVKDLTGKDPVRFRDFVEANKGVWG